MNCRLIKINNRPCDKEELDVLSRELELHPTMLELLQSRGITGRKNILDFLYPDASNFYDPYSMKDMDKAAERIRTAVAGKETVVVYGDYDADGICSAAILSLFLASLDLNVYTHIPNRAGDGYGLNIDTLERVIEDCCPDLIITCDCGISAVKEAAAVRDLGVDIVVTDHHEASRDLPDCPVVNPRRADCNYPFKQLCGAGVALKLVQALGGDIGEYMELAAVATIADLVPLTGENRLIVQLGLKSMKSPLNLGLKALLETQKQTGESVSSADIAFKIAPRINAAGRMGDAYRAFEMLTSDDNLFVGKIAAQINEDNNRRKEACEKLYEEALEDLKCEDMIDSRAIVLSNHEWEKGITGIVAARLSGEYKRVTFILVRSGEKLYKGTARSVEGVNLFELLSTVNDLLYEYGGHAQAAGFSIEEKNIAEFKRRVNEFLAALPDELFRPTVYYDLDLKKDDFFGGDLTKALELLEPTGNGNAKPLFKLDCDKLALSVSKSSPQNFSLTADCNLPIFAFNFVKKRQYLYGDASKSLILELQLNKYAGKETLRGLLKEVVPNFLTFDDELARAAYLKSLTVKTQPPPVYKTYDRTELGNIVGKLYGTLIVCGCARTYENFCGEPVSACVLHEFNSLTCKNNYSRVVVSPEFDELPSFGYDKVIFLDSPLSPDYISLMGRRTGATIFVPDKDNSAEFLKDIDLARETFLKYFTYLKQNDDLSAPGLFDYIQKLKVRAPISPPQLVVCLGVFGELGLVEISKKTFKVTVNKGIKSDLNNSPLYTALLKR